MIKKYSLYGSIDKPDSIIWLEKAEEFPEEALARDGGLLNSIKFLFSGTELECDEYVDNLQDYLQEKEKIRLQLMKSNP